MDCLLLTLTYNHSESDGEKTKQNRSILLTESTQNHPDSKITKNIKIIIIIIDHFYIAPFSALQQTYCAHMLFYTSE